MYSPLLPTSIKPFCTRFLERTVAIIKNEFSDTIKKIGTTMSESEEIKGEFRYDKDSKRYHRFQVKTKTGIVGTIYMPKESQPIPRKLILEYVGSS